MVIKALAVSNAIIAVWVAHLYSFSAFIVFGLGLIVSV